MNLDERVRDYAAATREFFEATALLSTDTLDRRGPGGWSARQIIHHMADSETQSGVRLRRLLAEAPGSLIQGYDENAWANNATLGYEELPVRPSLQVIESVRASTELVLGRLSEDDFSRYAQHTESGRYDLATWFDVYCEHPREHARQLRAALAS